VLMFQKELAARPAGRAGGRNTGGSRPCCILRRYPESGCANRKAILSVAPVDSEVLEFASTRRPPIRLMMKTGCFA